MVPLGDVKRQLPNNKTIVKGLGWRIGFSNGRYPKTKFLHLYGNNPDIAAALAKYMEIRNCKLIRFWVNGDGNGHTNQ
jgi:hypothetical protein